MVRKSQNILNGPKAQLCNYKGNNFHYACLRTYKGTILCLASNDEKRHAEINVIEKAKKKYTKRELRDFCKKGGLIIEIVRYHRYRNKCLISKPCNNCQNRIKNCQGIVAVYHS